MYKYILTSFFLCKRQTPLQAWRWPSRESRGCPDRQRTFLRHKSWEWTSLTKPGIPKEPFLIYCMKTAPPLSPPSLLSKKQAFPVQFLIIWVSYFKRFGSVILCQKSVHYPMPECLNSQSMTQTTLFLRCSVWISSGHKDSGCYIPLLHTLHCRSSNTNLA